MVDSLAVCGAITASRPTQHIDKHEAGYEAQDNYNQRTSLSSPYRLGILIIAMTIYMYAASLLLILTKTAKGDIQIITNQTVDHDYYNVQSFYQQGDYYMLYVKEPNTANNGYKIGVYIGDNITYHNINLGSNQDNTTSLRFSVRPGDASANVYSQIKVCSIHRCQKHIVLTGSFGTFPTQVSTFCRSDIDGRGNHLLAYYDRADGTTSSIVVKNSTGMYGFSCPQTSGSSPVPVYLLTCSAKDEQPLTEIQATETHTTESDIWVFSLRSNAQVTILCTHKIPKNQTSSRSLFKQENILRLEGSPTSLAISPAGEDFLAYISTPTGVVTKVYARSDNAFNISTYVVTPAMSSPVFPVMTLENDHLLLHSKNKLLILDVKETCEDHKDFCSCRKPKDPKCGWCLDANMCTSKSSCDSIWLNADPSSNTFCWNNTASPKSVARANPEPFKIQLYNDSDPLLLSGTARSFRCIYSNISQSPSAVSLVTSDGITCQPPVRELVDEAYQAGKSVELSVFVYHSDYQYLPMLGTYKMVICSDIDSCGECTDSHSTCTWCINDHKCVDTEVISSQCPNSPTANLQSEFGNSESCPAATITEIGVPINKDYPLALPINNFPTLTNVAYSCEVNDGSNSIERLNAVKDNSRIICSSHTYGSRQSPSSLWMNTFTVTVTAGAEQWKLAEVKGRVYDCAYHTACTQCIQEDTGGLMTDCVWCSQSSSCQFNRCPINDDVTKSGGQCPSLSIYDNQVTPTVVPVEGSLTLNIPGNGIILGEGYRTAVIKINNQKNCTDIDASESNNIDILHCTLPSMPAGFHTLTVEVNGIIWSRARLIRYYDPKMESIAVIDSAGSVRYGPMAGGTNVEITGRDLKFLLSETKWSLEFVNTKDSSDIYPLTDCEITRRDRIICETPEVLSLSSYYTKLRFAKFNYERDMTTPTFHYKPNSVVHRIEPESVVAWGSRSFIVNGAHLDSVYHPKVLFTGLADSYLRRRRQTMQEPTACINVTAKSMVCHYPEFSSPGLRQAIFMLDNVPKAQTTANITVLPNPVFVNFSDPKPKENLLILDAQNVDQLKQGDIEVKVGGKTCNITKIEAETVICIPPNLSQREQDEDTDVTVLIYGKERFRLGTVDYSIGGGLPKEVIAGIAASGAVLVVIAIIVVLLVFKRSRYHKQRYKSMVKQVDQLESNSRQEIKAAFAELQTDMSDLVSELNATGIPYWDYKNFTFKILFPGETDHPTLHKLMAKKKTHLIRGLDMFDHLLNHKSFLVTFVHTLETQPNFEMRDRVNLAALLMLTFQHKMGYITEVIKDLLSSLIDSTITKKHPKLLLRRSESVVEKMLTHWLSLSLYKYLQDEAGHPLFMLYQAIKHQIDKGPVDMLSGEARYSLSQERLLRLTVNANAINLTVTTDGGETVQCRVLDCDTPTQVKEKILDVIYKNQAFSIRPMSSDFNLEWCPENNVIHGVALCDEDITSKTENGWKRLNTLSHYLIGDNTRMRLISRYQTNSLHSNRSRDTDRLCGDTLTGSRGTPRGTPRNTLTRNGLGALSTSNLQDHYQHSHISLWHLSKSGAQQTLPKDRQQTMMSEIFLTRLLKTKGTLQEFIDKLFTAIFSANSLPPTIKILFDFLDSEAARHGVTDPEVVHVWKNNSLNLRFWVNIIKNPEFVFDINKTEIVDASLSTIAQTFIDSCAMTESDFGLDAPINKLLFARDRPRYRKKLQNMYTEIKNQETPSQKVIDSYHEELSEAYPKEFYRNSALKEIYLLANKYQIQILDRMETSPDISLTHKAPLFRDICSMLKDIDLRSYEQYERNGALV